MPKETGIPPKKSAFCRRWVRWNLTLVETFCVVIPKQDTQLCIADRSLSRLRGSPLPGAGFWALGPAWVGLSCRTRTPRPLVLRGCVCPAECCCGGCAAGARLGRLRRLSLGRVRGLRLALVHLSCRVLLRRLCRRGALGWLCPWIDTWCMECGRSSYVGALRLRWTRMRFSPLYKQSPPLRGGCRREPAGWCAARAPTLRFYFCPAALIPGRLPVFWQRSCSNAKDGSPVWGAVFLFRPSGGR